MAPTREERRSTEFEGAGSDDVPTPNVKTSQAIKQAKRKKKKNKNKNKQGKLSEETVLATPDTGETTTSPNPPPKAAPPSSESKKNDEPKHHNGPLVIDGNHGRGESTSSARRFALHSDNAHTGGGEAGRRRDGADCSTSAGDLERNGAPIQRSTNETGDGSDTSCTLQADSPSHGQRRREVPDNSPAGVFESNGIFFGNHADSTGPSRSDSPASHTFPPDHSLPQHQGPVQLGPQYPFMPHHPAYHAYPNPFYTSHGMIHGGYLHGYAAPYGHPLYLAPYHTNPMYGIPYHPYPPPGDYTPYSSGDSPVNYENETWSRGNPTQLCTPVTVHSDRGVSGAVRAQQAAEPAGCPDTHEAVNGEGVQQESEKAQTVLAGSPMLPDISPCDPSADKGPDVDLSPALPNEEPEESDDLEPVSNYLLRLFKSGELTDYQLILDSPMTHFYPMPLPAHGVVIARSACLNARMQAIERDECTRLLRISTGNSFVHPKAFEIAVQNLYGLPLVDEDQLASPAFLALGYDQDCNGKIPSAHNPRMDFALCYAASGAFLGNNSIARRGIQLAVSAINWDTVETAFRFGLAASSFTLTFADDIAPQSSEHDSANFHESEGGDAAPAESTAKPSEICSNTPNEEFVEVLAPEVLRQALKFVVENVPADFEVDTKARPTVMPDRLPEIPRLASSFFDSLKFGDFGGMPDNHSREATIASAIMLSLPLKELRKVFKWMRVKGTLTQKLAEDVVSERERRRLRAVRVLNSRCEDYSDSSLLEAFGWEESVRAKDAEGRLYRQFSIVRSWRGYHAGPMVFDP